MTSCFVPDPDIFAFDTLFQNPVAEVGHQRCAAVLPQIPVQELLESFFQGLLEERIGGETRDNHRSVMVVQVQHFLDELRVV